MNKNHKEKVFGGEPNDEQIKKLFNYEVVYSGDKGYGAFFIKDCNNDIHGMWGLRYIKDDISEIWCKSFKSSKNKKIFSLTSKMVFEKAFMNHKCNCIYARVLKDSNQALKIINNNNMKYIGKNDICYFYILTKEEYIINKFYLNVINNENLFPLPNEFNHTINSKL